MKSTFRRVGSAVALHGASTPSSGLDVNIALPVWMCLENWKKKTRANATVHIGMDSVDKMGRGCLL